MKRAPTLSSPSPLGRTLPNAVSRRIAKSSANSASSGRLLKIVRASSRVIGGPSNVVDEPEASESVRRDEEGDRGGVGIGDSLPWEKQIVRNNVYLGGGIDDTHQGQGGGECHE